jgi:hypothetical protein
MEIVTMHGPDESLHLHMLHAYTVEALSLPCCFECILTKVLLGILPHQ